MQVKYYTESGHELSQQDIDDINRNTKRDTVKNVLAAFGIAAGVYLGYTFYKSRTES